MTRQPVPGAGAAGRSPSGAAARAAAPPPSPPSPLPPQRYRALRARYNALLVALYERTSLTLREIAALAGCTDRAVQMLLRALRCRPRNERCCRPGTDVGVRRAGPKPAPLNAPATRRVAAAFAEVARELAASAQMRAASELQRASARAARRTARTQSRVMAGAARQLRHLAAAMEDTAAARQALAGGRKAGQSRAPATAPKPRSRPDLRLAQERVLRDQEALMRQAHRAKAAPASAPSHPFPASGGGLGRGVDADADRRIDEIAARYGAESRKGPRIRGL
jgi:hypothetical protein